jgi:hypothetical protein
MGTRGECQSRWRSALSCVNMIVAAHPFVRATMRDHETSRAHETCCGSAEDSVSTFKQRKLSIRALIVGVCLAAPLLAGCNEPRFLIPAPTLRGITIPLPPPSFADEVLVHIDVEGTVPFGFDNPGTQAFLYEKVTGRGYFITTDGMGFTIYDVLVDVGDNCMHTWFVDGVDGSESSTISYKAVLHEGEEACSDLSCSAPDELGVCLCLEKWTVGC